MSPFETLKQFPNQETVVETVLTFSTVSLSIKDLKVWRHFLSFPLRQYAGMCPCVPCLSTSPKRQRQRRTVLPQRPCCESRVAVKTERWYCRCDAFTPVIGLLVSRGFVSHRAVRQSKAALIHSWLSPHSQTEKHKMTNTDEVSVQRKTLYLKAIKGMELKFNNRLQKHYSWTPKPSNTEAAFTQQLHWRRQSLVTSQLCPKVVQLEDFCHFTDISKRQSSYL